MDSAVVLIEANGGTPLPRRLSVLGAECDLFWRGAGPYCYYCKGAGHWVTACERLAKRKQRSKKTSSSQPGPLQPPVPPLSPMLIPTPMGELQGSSSLRKHSAGTRPTASPPEHSFIAEETPPLERRRKKKAKGKQQEARKEPAPLPVLESGASSPLMSPMHTSPNLSDDEVILALAPVTGPAPFRPSLPPGFQRVDKAVTPPPSSTPNTLPPSSLSTPRSSSRRVLYPLSWEEATPLDFFYLDHTPKLRA